MLVVVLATLSVILAGMTLLPVWRHEAWWVRALDFPRLQLAIALLLLLLAEAACLFFIVMYADDAGAAPAWLTLRDQPAPWFSALLLTVTAACFFYQASWIRPYSRLFPLEVKQADDPSNESRLCLMIANVLTPNRNAAALLDLVTHNRPDILVTLESDEWWQSQLDDLAPDYPYSVKCPLDNLYGMHVYSRLRLQDAAIHYLVEQDVPSIHVTVELNNSELVRAFFVHPAPPAPSENLESAERDAELLIVARLAQDIDSAVIVTGDLNDVAWSSTTRLFRKVSGLLDPRIGRGMYNSYSARHWFLRWPLDQLFHSDHFKLSRIQRLGEFGSDHFPILVELDYARKHRPQQDGIEADPNDIRRAREKIRDI